MKKKSLKQLGAQVAVGTTLLAGAAVLSTDLTPDSWKAHAMSGKSDSAQDKGAEHSCGEGKCGEGKCGSKDKGAEKSCGADHKKAKKGSEGSCGESTCGA